MSQSLRETAAERVAAAQSYPEQAARMRVLVLIQHGAVEVAIPPKDNRNVYEAIGLPDKTIKP